MDIILTPSLFCEYFDDYLNFPKTEYQIQISNLFMNVNNRFIISKDLISYLEKKYSQSPIGAFFQPFMADLFNNRSLTVGSIKQQSSANDIHTAIEEAYLSLGEEKVRSVHYSLINEGTSKSENVIDIKRISLKKKDWLHFGLCCQNPAPIVLGPTDFKTDQDIKEMIADFFHYGGGKKFNILDRQANFDHQLFDFFRKSEPVLYFTTAKTYADNQEIFKKFFASVQLFFAPKSQIHERKIHRNNYILHTDNDFWSLNMNDSTWTVFLSYDKIRASLLTQKTDKFQKKRR